MKVFSKRSRTYRMVHVRFIYAAFVPALPGYVQDVSSDQLQAASKGPGFDSLTQQVSFIVREQIGLSLSIDHILPKKFPATLH